MSTFISILCTIPGLLFFVLVIVLLKSRKGKVKIGEQVLIHFLNKLNSTEYKIVNNLTLKVHDRAVQIDHIVISRSGLFVIETEVRA